MARICDVDRNDEDVRVVDFVNDAAPDFPGDQGRGTLSGFDACAPCRDALIHGGLPELMQRYGAAHKLLKRTRKPT